MKRKANVILGKSCRNMSTAILWYNSYIPSTFPSERTLYKFPLIDIGRALYMYPASISLKEDHFHEHNKCLGRRCSMYPASILLKKGSFSSAQ